MGNRYAPIYALCRKFAGNVNIDCQSPAFHQLRWNEAIRYVLSEAKKQLGSEIRLGTDDLYIPKKAAESFELNIEKLYREKNNSILIIFDEIENITPTVSPSPHWCNDIDFVYFWQTIRSVFQKKNDMFSYLVVGTNPLCVEMEKVCGKDNPIYGQIPLEYIPRFDVPQTRDMVRRLGRIMGLQFDEILYARITDDFGGHPYLMRHACSVINRLANKHRPATVDKALYEKAKQEFMRNYSHFMEMILNVLKQYFSDEYDMLQWLSIGDLETFKTFALNSPLYTNHLIGYGIITETDGRYSFRIESIKEYLVTKNRYRKTDLSQAEMWQEISARRNVLEQKLRRVCRMQMKSFYGESKAHENVANIYGEKRKGDCTRLAYLDLFDNQKINIFFSDITKIISKHWTCFEHIFETDKTSVVHSLETINSLRADAHATNLDSSDFTLFRIGIEKIEKVIDRYLS